MIFKAVLVPALLPRGHLNAQMWSYSSGALLRALLITVPCIHCPCRSAVRRMLCLSTHCFGLDVVLETAEVSMADVGIWGYSLQYSPFLQPQCLFGLQQSCNLWTYYQNLCSWGTPKLIAITYGQWGSGLDWNLQFWGHVQVLNVCTVFVSVHCLICHGILSCWVGRYNFFFLFIILDVSQRAYAYLLPDEQEMLHGASVLCIEIVLILYISYAGDILESLSMNSDRFRPKA